MFLLLSTFLCSHIANWLTNSSPRMFPAFPKTLLLTLIPRFRWWHTPLFVVWYFHLPSLCVISFLTTPPVIVEVFFKKKIRKVPKEIEVSRAIHQPAVGVNVLPGELWTVVTVLMEMRSCSPQLRFTEQLVDELLLNASLNASLVWLATSYHRRCYPRQRTTGRKQSQIKVIFLADLAYLFRDSRARWKLASFSLLNPPMTHSWCMSRRLSWSCDTLPLKLNLQARKISKIQRSLECFFAKGREGPARKQKKSLQLTRKRKLHLTEVSGNLVKIWIIATGNSYVPSLLYIICAIGF